jgi:phosphoadenosine phosphosulfate reductase
MPVSIDNIIDRNITSGAEVLSLPNRDEYLEKINQHLASLHPQQILEWAIDHLPNLYQTTAFGLSGKESKTETSRSMLS